MLHRSLASTPIHDAKFIYDIEALSLAYGFYPLQEGIFDQASRFVMFVDVGYEHTTVFITVFKSNLIKVLYSSSSLSVSSRWIDQLLVKLVEEKVEACGITHEVIEANKRLKAEIRSMVDKHKVTFSTVEGEMISFSLNIPFSDPIDVTITQKEFQELCESSGFLGELRRLCETSLDYVGGVNEAILEGSGTRLCFFADIIRNLLNNPKYKRNGVLR